MDLVDIRIAKSVYFMIKQVESFISSPKYEYLDNTEKNKIQYNLKNHRERFDQFSDEVKLYVMLME